jgi:hypothetical protein
VKIVNGYVCQTTCDVTAAKKGLDPRNPHDDPIKAAQLNATKGVLADPGSSQAVTFGGTLDALKGRRGGDLAPVARLLDLVA